jgi:hypothetical protein
LSDSPSSRHRALQPSFGQFERVITLGDRLIATLVVHWPVPWIIEDARAEMPNQADARWLTGHRLETLVLVGRIIVRGYLVTTMFPVVSRVENQ